MGIKGLMKVISDHAPHAIKESGMEAYFGRKVAVDASMSLYQFIISVRGQDGNSLTNDNGEVTSHLQGMFYRTIRMMDHGIKPAFVFDGKPPTMKGGELEKRKERRDEAEEGLKEATEAGNAEDIEKFNKRLVRVTKEQNADAKTLLRLMGVPVIEAPCEAEAQAAALCAAGKVYATATEDMDALTFGTTRLVRHMTFAAARKKPIVEIDLAKTLDGLDMTTPQFIDFCILLGCDYTGTIKGIGPKKALELIRKHKSIEECIANGIDLKKYTVSEEFQSKFKPAAELFVTPEVTDPNDVELVWSAPDEEKLLAFLVDEKGFSTERVKSGIARLQKARNKGAQKRMDSFFSMKPPSADAAKKRKADEEKKKASAKKKKK